MAHPHIIIDGYNLIRQVPYLSHAEQFSLENGRQKLIHILAQYRRHKSHKITVVFDGSGTLSEFASPYREAGVSVCFSPGGQSADEVIQNMCLNKQGSVIVVSSDRGVTDFAKAHGAAIISAPEFYRRLRQINERNTGTGLSPDKIVRGTHKRWTTQKKGPQKRLPKKLRRNQNRLNTL